jgi:hypothetical protein
VRVPCLTTTSPEPRDGISTTVLNRTRAWSTERLNRSFRDAVHSSVVERPDVDDAKDDDDAEFVINARTNRRATNRRTTNDDDDDDDDDDDEENTAGRWEWELGTRLRASATSNARRRRRLPSVGSDDG